MAEDSMRQLLAVLPERIDPTPAFADALLDRLERELKPAPSTVVRRRAWWDRPGRWLGAVIALLGAGIGATQLVPASRDGERVEVVVPAPSTTTTTTIPPDGVAPSPPTTARATAQSRGAVPAGGAPSAAAPPTTVASGEQPTASSAASGSGGPPTARKEVRVVFTVVKANTASKDGDIVATRPDGSGYEVLTSSEDSDLWPAVAPDGTRIAFVRRGYLSVLDVATRQVKRVLEPDGYTDGFPAWSPDGRWLAVTRADDANAGCMVNDTACDARVWVVSPDGQTRRDLGSGQHPTWTPDGRIVFGRIGIGCEGTNDTSCEAPLYVMNADGSGVRPLGLTGSFPKVSPDGKQLVFEHGDKTNVDIWVANIDGSSARAITAAPMWDGQPAWTPDGWVVFSHVPTNQPQGIARMRPDGTAFAVIARNGTNPAGGYIAVT